MPEFTISIKVDSKGAVRSVKAVETQLKKTEAQAKKTQGVLKKAFAGVAVGQAAMQSVRFLANFAQEMSTVKAITNATGKEFSALRQKAIDLGTTTRFTSQQAASGMLFLARSGFEVNEILEAIPGTLNLAQAGALGLGRAADIATNILKGFGLATSETNRVVDVLALAANSANTTVEQLGQAMKFVAPIASGVRMSLEDTAAAIQVLSNAGIQASMAGTGLRRVIGALEGPTTAQERVLNDLGLTTDEVKVSQVGLAGALAKIRSRTNDVGIALKLFGQRGGPAAVVMANLWKEMDKFGVANLDAAGTATRIAEVMDDNLNGAILRVKSAFQGLLILLGDVSAVSSLRSFLEILANSLRFLARNARGLNEAIAILVTGFVLYRAALVKVSIATIKWGSVMKAAIGPQVIMGVAALAAIMVLLQDEISIAGEEWVTFGDVGQAAAEDINEAFMGMQIMMGQTSGAAEKGWKGVFSNISTMSLAMVQSLAQGLDRIGGFFIGLWKAAVVVNTLMEDAFREGFVNINNKIVDILGGTFKWIIDRWNDVAVVLGHPIIKDFDPDVFKLDQLPGEALKTGADIGIAFKEGFKSIGAEDLFLSMITDAEKLAMSKVTLSKPTKASEPQEAPAPIFGPDAADGGRGKLPPTFAELAAKISEETWLLSLNSREMEVQQRLIQMEEKMKKRLTPVQAAIATAMLKQLQIQQEMATVYDEIKGPEEDLIARHTAIVQLYRDLKLSVEEYQGAMDQLKISQLELNTDMQSGLERGLLKMKVNLQDLAYVAENVVTNAFRGAEDALVKFVTTGEMNFSQLIDSILQDLTRLLVRKALLSLIPGLGPAAGALPITAATGTQFTVGGSGGTDSQFVPMQVTPGERVTVETPKQQAASDNAGSAGANIKIVNVTDPDEIADAMASREGEQVILNTISRNRTTVRNGLA